MSLEQMKKEELVKGLRTAQQTIKDLEFQLKEATTSNAEVPDNIGNVEEVELPYKGISLLRDGVRFFNVLLKFDLKGNAKVISKTEANSEHMAFYNAEVLLSSEIDRQEVLSEDRQ